LARSQLDLSRVLASLNIWNQFTFAVCLYNMWTIVAALILSFLLRRRGITTVPGIKKPLSSDSDHSSDQFLGFCGLANSPSCGIAQRDLSGTVEISQMRFPEETLNHLSSYKRRPE
jgi:hypothetical protein